MMTSRNTEQRTIVLDALKALANHPTAEDVYEFVHQSHPSISKSTVYRLLNKLSDDGQATHVHISNGADHYDHLVGEHYHVRCSICGKVDDVMIPLLSDLDEKAAAVSQYRIEGYTLQFNGICPECSAARKAGSEICNDR